MTTTVRRLRASLVAAVAGALLVPALTSPARAADVPAAKASSTWLAGELVDGAYPKMFGGSDYGLMIDALFAMVASGDAATAAPIVEVLRSEHLNYTTFAEFLGEDGKDDKIGGATAKVLVAALAVGENPRSFGGTDLVAATRATISTEAKTLGKVQDKGPNIGSDNANLFGQALAVIGLAGTGHNDRSAIDSLVSQQCSEGFFRIFYSYTAAGAVESCDEGKTNVNGNQSSPDRDSTGFGLSALLAARKAGANGLDAPIAAAVAWLTSEQQAGGGWGGGVGTEAPNTNSTGLIVQALAEAGGATAAVDQGTAYLKSAQVTAADSGNDLAGEVGAIAYTPAEYVAARSGGISSLDTWIRAGAQASLGLSQVGFSTLVGAAPALPAKSLAIAASARPVARGTSTPVTASGLAPGEAYRITLSGVLVRQGVASATGRVTTKITVPASFTTASRALRITGSEPNRSGQRALVVAAPKKVAVTVAKKSVKRGKAQKITVAGLLAGEKVTVAVTGRTAKVGYANAAGRFVVTFAAQPRVGTKTVTVCGVTCTRKGATTYRVVR